MASHSGEGKKADDRVKQLYEWADRLETKLNTASENGLFQHQTKIKYHEILNPLMIPLSLCVQEKLSPESYQRARENYDNAQDLFFQALQAVSFLYRLIYVYAFHVLGYLITILALIVWLDLGILPRLGGQVSVLSIPLSMLLCGAFGSVIRSLWYLWYNVNRLEYRNIWSTWYVISPVMGGLLGGVVYLAFVIGLVTTTLKVDLANPILAYLLAIVAGYNWEWANGVIKSVEDKLSSKSTTSSGSK